MFSHRTGLSLMMRAAGLRCTAISRRTPRSPESNRFVTVNLPSVYRSPPAASNLVSFKGAKRISPR